MDDISRHDEAAPIILAKGVAAIPALSEYLEGAPQSVPQARRFAVAMLAAIPGQESEAALERALHVHDIRAFSPDVAASERLVQNDAFRALLDRASGSIPDALPHALEVARLPAAVEAVGRLSKTEYIPIVIDMLADDYLSAAAHKALARIGSAAESQLISTLESEPRDTATLRRLLMVIDLLAHLASPATYRALERLLNPSQPIVAASAALALLALDPNRDRSDLALPIVRGSMLPELTLARRCLDALRRLPDTALCECMASVSGTNYLPDLYGTPRPIGVSQRALLAAQLLSRAGVDASSLVVALPEAVLQRALHAAAQVPNAATAAALRNHPDKNVRETFRRLRHTGTNR